MGVTTTQTNKPFNPRGNDQSPKGYNRAALYSGKALDFDGVNDWVNTTYSSGFTGAQEFTYCAYINADTNQETEAIIHGNENTGWGLQSLQLRYETNGIRFFAGTGSSSTSYVDSDPIEANKWYFVVGTHTPTENKIYLNGALNATATAGSLTTAPQAITIGAYPGSSVAFNGEISSPRIFDVALTAAQVADLYNNPEKVVPTGVDNTALKLWLPMMEGAGTTAYDGSGNGNHGTISGATYVNGIGAPVAQSAVIDWNKGTNLFEYSEQFDQSSWSKSNATLTSGQSAPDESSNAYKIVFSNANAYIQNTTHNLDTSTNYTLSCWVKSDGANTDFRIGNISAGSFETRTATSEWQRFEITQTPSSATRYPRPVHPVTGSETLYIWGAQLEKVSSAGAYIPNHTGASLTSDVLLPQGLTSGRDITGVNLFENVRKQGALNLDGNSWAEVHDNESLDITSAITLEAWVYFDSNNSNKGLLGKWYTSSSNRAWLIYQVNATQLRFIISDNGTNTNAISSNALSEGWNHFIGVDDGTNIKVYSNGSLDSTGASYGSLYEVNKSLQIGIWNSETIKQFPNQIAQPRIYNRALTAEEVQRNYNAGKNTYTNS